VQAWTTPRDVGLRGPLTPGPAVSERRDDVLPADHVEQRHGPAAWTAALVASIARTGWLPAVVTITFVGAAFAATAVAGRSVSTAVPWVLIGGGFWLLIAVAWTLLRKDR
jgi:hypothetical protein